MTTPKRTLALLMTMLMLISLLSAPASADEPFYEKTDAYVLNFSSQDVPGYEDWDNKRLWASPYQTNITVYNPGQPEPDDEGYEDWWAPCSVLNMINTAKIGTVSDADTPYASIPVYCVDGFSDGQPGHSYRRVNLEDSGYFSDATAGRLRNIILNSWPCVTEADLTEAVNAWNAATGSRFAAVESLNYAEMISASQSVIWTLTNDGWLHDDLYARYYPGKYSDEEILYPESIDFTVNTADDDLPGTTANNIAVVAAYLNALAPMTARETVVTDAAFSDVSVEYQDSCAIVTANVAASIDSGDNLVLTAVCGDVVSEPQSILDGANSYIVTLDAVDPTEPITLNIDGTQDAADVFLFDPENGRFSSQSMAGYDSSLLPVHAEAVIAPRILELTKRGTVTAADGTEETVYLKNVAFEIYFVCAPEDYANGNVILSAPPAVSEAEQALYMTESNRIATIITDEDGKASYNFTLNGSPDGIYIIRELHHEATTGPMAPFYLEVPRTAEDGSLVTTIEISPKNTVKQDDVEIKKDVNEIDNDHDTHDVGEIHTWIIRSTIPEGLSNALRYEITDTLNYQLTYAGNLRVTVSEADAPAHEDLLTLTEGEDYILTVTPGTVDVSGEAEEITSFFVALTPEGMQTVAETEGTAPELRVYFDAFIDEDAIVFTEIPNRAHIHYENNIGIDFDRDSDIPEVHTGAGQILKLDAADHGKKLTGAAFWLYRPASEADTDVEYLEVGGESIPVVRVSFYDNAEMTGDKVWEVVSDENGRGVLYGLAYGTYYLVETNAPDGYHLLTEPAELTITQADSVDQIVVTIYNSARFRLPETGGIGTAMFTLGGAGILGAAAALLLSGKKKRR